MNAIEEIDNLILLVPQELRLALKNCEALDTLAADARHTAYKARVQVCKDCPHPAQFIVSYYTRPSLEGRVCRLCGLHEAHKCTGYRVLDMISYSDDHLSSHRVEFDVAMSCRTMTAEELRKPL